jgi:hypothetical protein
MSDHPVPTPARTPTPEEIQANREWAVAKNERIITKKQTAEGAVLDLAEELWEWDMRQGWLWLTEDDSYRHLSDWLADPQVGMTRATYYRLLKAYRPVAMRLIPMTVAKELDHSKLAVVSKALCKGEVSAAEAIADVKASGWRDLRGKYEPAVVSDDPSVAALQQSVAALQQTNGADSQESTPEAPGTASTTVVDQAEGNPTAGAAEPPEQAESVPEHHAAYTLLQTKEPILTTRVWVEGPEEWPDGAQSILEVDV